MCFCQSDCCAKISQFPNIARVIQGLSAKRFDIINRLFKSAIFP
ncbi:Uncharacterised protein [Klebsiella variicola]|nr:Uncharacterised protein [Klebsiella variicola]